MNCSQPPITSKYPNSNNCIPSNNFISRVGKSPVAGLHESQRVKYDKEYIENDLRTTARIQEYVFDPAQIHPCHPCRSDEIGSNSKFGVSYNPNLPLVDTESQLRNLNVNLNRDTSVNYLPGSDMSSSKVLTEGDCNLYHFQGCSLGKEFTRLNNPAWTLRETGVNRFQPTYLNHQDRSHWEIQTPTLVSARQLARDSYVPRIPCLIDQSVFLPKGDAKLPCRTVVINTCDL